MAQMVKDKEVNPLVLQKKFDKFQTPQVEPTVQVPEISGEVAGFEQYENEHTYGGKMSPIRYQSQSAQKWAAVESSCLKYPFPMFI